MDQGPSGGSFALEGLARKGRIRMATATELARHRPSDGKDFTFVIKVPGRDWVLDPGSEAAYQMWEAKLRPPCSADVGRPARRRVGCCIVILHGTPVVRLVATRFFANMRY